MIEEQVKDGCKVVEMAIANSAECAYSFATPRTSSTSRCIMVDSAASFFLPLQRSGSNVEHVASSSNPTPAGYESRQRNNERARLRRIMTLGKCDSLWMLIHHTAALWQSAFMVSPCLNPKFSWSGNLRFRRSTLELFSQVSGNSLFKSSDEQ